MWLAELSQKDTPHAVGKAVSALRAILNVAVEWGVIAANPAARLRLPKPADDDDLAPERVLSKQQLDQLFASAADDPRVDTLFRSAGEAGLRRGEIMGLRWTDLDLSRRRLTVARAVWQQAGVDGAPPTRIIKAPKSGKTRTVAISQTFATRLADWYAASVVEAGNDATGYVWPGRSGGLMGSSTVAQILLRRLDALDMVENTKATRPEKEHPRGLVTLHGLRHTAASIMLGAGVPLIVVSRQLGHANPNITAKVYAHLVNRDEQLDSAAAVFDAPERQESAEELEAA